MSVIEKFQVGFAVPKKVLGEVIAALHPFKVEGLSFQPVAPAGVVDKNGLQKPGWKTATELVIAAGRPVEARELVPQMVKLGYASNSAYSFLSAAAAKKTIRKTDAGYVGVKQ